MFGGLGSSQYTVGDIAYTTLSVSKPDLEVVLQKAGLTIEYYEEVSIEGQCSGLYNGTKWYNFIAKKLG